MKRFIKYTSRIVLGLLTIFWGLATYLEYTPDESYHHCEAGQNDGNPVYVALIAVASFIVFCFVWYKTKEWPSDKKGEDFPKEGEIPEPYKNFVDIDKFISKIVWVKIENENEVVSYSGLYLFNCRGDNHTFMELHEIKEGERLCKYYQDHHFDGWAVVKPIEYHFVKDDEKEFVINMLEIKDDRQNI